MQKMTQGMKAFVFLCFSFVNTNICSQEVVFVKGTVKVSPKEGDSFVKVSIGQALALGSFIKTEANSLVIVSFPSGSTLKIDPESEVEISELKKEKEDQNDTSVFRLIKGAIVTKFIKGQDKELIVENEHVALAVRGTEFFFGEDENEAYAAVNSGEIAVIKKGDFDYEPVKAGNALVIENKKELTKAESFEWAKKLNWGSKVKGVGESSGFKNSNLRKLRRTEVAQKIRRIRQRKKKVFKGKLKGNLQRAIKRRTSLRKGLKNRDQVQKNRPKQKVQNLKKRQPKQKVQEFKKRMNKRGVLRRRRN
jgi:hypothetical protein